MQTTLKDQSEFRIASVKTNPQIDEKTCERVAK